MFDLNPLSMSGKSIELTTLLRVLLPLGVIAVVAILFFSLCAKSKKGVFITKICLASTLSALYIFRFIFWIVRVVHISSNHTFTTNYLPRALGLDVPSYLILLSIASLFMSAFSKKQHKTLEFFEHTLLGVGLTYGLISIFRLDMIDVYDNLYHALNIQAIIFMIALIFVPLYLIKTNELKPKLSKFWYAIAGYTCIASLCMTVSLIMFNGNISEMTYSSTLRKIGWTVSFPWHLLIVIPVFLIICFAVYWIVSIIYNKVSLDTETHEYHARNEFFDLYSFATKSICCLQGLLILIILATLIRKPLGTPLGLLCLLPFIMTVFCVYASFEMDKQSSLNDEHVFDKGNKNIRPLIAYTLIGNVIFGLVLVKQIKNEREAIEYRKERIEKKRLKEQQKQEENKNGKI